MGLARRYSTLLKPSIEALAQRSVDTARERNYIRAALAQIEPERLLA